MVLDEAVSFIQKSGGTIRSAEAIRAGIHQELFYKMVHDGVLVQQSRGVYQLSELETSEFHDLAVVAARVPRSVVTLISALSFHELTTQIPHAVSIAIPAGYHAPHIGFPSITTFHVSGDSFSEGVETHLIEGVAVKMYSPEKTIADCFKFRNKIGMDVVLEAIKLYRIRRKPNYTDLLKYAKVCRVDSIIRPYLEAIL